MIAVGVLVLVLGLGAMGVVAGTGFFGYRSLLYGEGQLYVLNMSAEPLYVSVDGREKVDVPAQNAQLIDIIGGETQAVVTDANEEIRGRYAVFTDNSHAFLKLSDEQCLAIVNLDPYYRSGSSADIEIVETLDEKTRVWIPDSKNVVWPRKPFPKRLSAGEGQGTWIELVGCPLLEDPKFLDAYLAVRLDERMKKALGKKK